MPNLYRSFLIILHCSLSCFIWISSLLLKSTIKHQPSTVQLCLRGKLTFFPCSFNNSFFGHLFFSLLTPSSLGHGVSGRILFYPAGGARAADPLHEMEQLVNYVDCGTAVVSCGVFWSSADEDNCFTKFISFSSFCRFWSEFNDLSLCFLSWNIFN